MIQETPALKIIGYTTIIFAVEYTWASPEMFWLLVALMIFDTITGIWKRYALAKDLTSRWLWVWVMSKISVLVMLLLLGWSIKLTGLSNQMAISAVIGLFIWAELFSSIQNIYIMHSKKEITEFDAISRVLWWLIAIVRKFIENMVTK